MKSWERGRDLVPFFFFDWACRCVHDCPCMQVFVSFKVHEGFFLQLQLTGQKPQPQQKLGHTQKKQNKTTSVPAVGLYVNSLTGQGDFFSVYFFFSTGSFRPAHLPSIQAQTAATATPAVKNHLKRPHLTINSTFVQCNDPLLLRSLGNCRATELLGFSCDCVLPGKRMSQGSFTSLLYWVSLFILLIQKAGCASAVRLPVKYEQNTSKQIVMSEPGD